MARLQIDELNTYDKQSSKMRSIPYDRYFGEMDLDEEEKEVRIALARSIEQVFSFLFIMIGIEIALGNSVEVAYYIDMVARKFKEAIESNGISLDAHPQLSSYVDGISKDIVNATVEGNDEKKDPYLTSDDRAIFIAENEANSIRNMIQLEEAIKKGFTKKKWVTKMDRKVRHTHKLVNGEIIGIYDTFKIGDSEMHFPKDNTLGADAKEIVNCRCVLKFLR